MTNPITALLWSAEFERRAAWPIFSDYKSNPSHDIRWWIAEIDSVADAIPDEIEDGECLGEAREALSRHAIIAQVLFEICEPYSRRVSVQSPNGANYDFLEATYRAGFLDTVKRAASLLDKICPNPDKMMDGAPRWSIKNTEIAGA